MKNKVLISLVGMMLGMSILVTGCGSKSNVEENTPQTSQDSKVDEEISDEEINETEDDSTEESDTEAEEAVEERQKLDLEDGVYQAEFHTDSTMFHVNEALGGLGIMTVEEGYGTIHICMPSKNIVTLYPGLKENVEGDEDKYILAVEDDVTYSDGFTETVNAFDVPVPYLDEEFDLALIGTKGVWYDHKVYVSNPVPYEGEKELEEEVSDEETEELEGIEVNLTLEGGSGRSTVTSPTVIKEGEDGKLYLVVEWSSPNYDYMIVGEEKLLPVNTEGNSVFELPVNEDDEVLEVIADTVAMSTPHEIEYTIKIEK